MNAAPAGPPKSLLIVRLGAMGDVIHTLHAVAVLRRALRDTQIGWVIEERWSELLYAKGRARSGPRSPALPLVDFVHLVDTKRWRKSPFTSSTRSQISAVLGEIRTQRYEIAIDFQGAIKSAFLARLSGPQHVIGMDRPRESPARLFYSRRVQTAGAHVIEQYQSLAQALLAEAQGEADDQNLPPHSYDSRNATLFPTDDAAEIRIREKLLNNPKPIVVLNPGAGWGAKEWPAQRYGAAAKLLAKQGYAVFVNYGPGEERLAQSVLNASECTATALCPSMGELIALTRRACLFIGGDTGPMHLAAALGVPVVALFGPTDPARNGPFGTRCIVLRNPGSRNSLSHTSMPDAGLLQITPQEVIRASRELLENKHA